MNFLTKKALLGAFLFASVSGVMAANAPSVTDVIKKEFSRSAKYSACTMLKLANMAASSADERKEKNEAIRTVTQKINQADPSMLHARGDVARKGLYGFKQDQSLAFKFYERSKSPDAGFNAALMLYQQGKWVNDQKAAAHILHILDRSKAIAANSRGSAGAQGNYIAGVINEGGQAGKTNQAAAFKNFRASARQSYVPGIYNYLRILMATLPKLTEKEQQGVLQEIRLMTNRWRGQSARVMMITGDMHAHRWFPDDADGFFAQFYWRIAEKMNAQMPDPELTKDLNQRAKRLDKEKEKRLEEAVVAAMRNVNNANHPLEYIDLCLD